MRKFALGALGAFLLAAAVAWAVPLSPGLGIAPGPQRVVGTWHLFGGFGGVDNTPVTITISDSAVWYPVTNGTDNLWVTNEGTAIAFTADNIVISNKGDYVGTAVVTVSGTTGNDIFFRAFSITDNAITGRSVGGTVTGATNYTPISIPLYIEADAADHVFQLQVRNISATANVSIRTGIVELHYLHE